MSQGHYATAPNPLGEIRACRRCNPLPARRARVCLCKCPRLAIELGKSAYYTIRAHTMPSSLSAYPDPVLHRRMFPHSSGFKGGKWPPPPPAAG